MSRIVILISSCTTWLYHYANMWRGVQANKAPHNAIFSRLLLLAFNSSQIQIFSPYLDQKHSVYSIHGLDTFLRESPEIITILEEAVPWFLLERPLSRSARGAEQNPGPTGNRTLVVQAVAWPLYWDKWISLLLSLFTDVCRACGSITHFQKQELPTLTSPKSHPSTCYSMQPTRHDISLSYTLLHNLGAHCSILVKALCYKQENRGFEARWDEFLNLPNLCGRIRPWASKASF
jgi:hypothetical protein